MLAKLANALEMITISGSLGEDFADAARIIRRASLRTEPGYMGSLRWIDFFDQLCDHLTAEGAEPGRHAGVTWAEMCEAFWSAWFHNIVKGGLSRIRPAVWEGSERLMPSASGVGAAFGMAFGQLAYFLGEGRGVGEMTPDVPAEWTGDEGDPGVSMPGR